MRNAKLNLFKIRRGTGSWEDASKDAHSIPFAVQGKCGSVEVTLMPAPKGKGLIVEKEVKKILELAGIQNAWSKIRGQAKNKFNLVKATEEALRNLSRMKIKTSDIEKFSIVEGPLPSKKESKEEVEAQ